MEDNRILENTYDFRLGKYKEIFDRETAGIDIPKREMDLIEKITKIIARIPAKYVFTEYVKTMNWISFDLNLGSGILVDITVPLNDNEKMLSLFSFVYEGEMKLIDENFDLEELVEDLTKLYNEANK